MGRLDGYHDALIVTCVPTFICGRVRAISPDWQILQVFISNVGVFGMRWVSKDFFFLLFEFRYQGVELVFDLVELFFVL